MSIKGVNWRLTKNKNKFGNFNQILLNSPSLIMINNLLLIVSKSFKMKKSVGIISDTWAQEFRKKVEIVMIF